MRKTSTLLIVAASLFLLTGTILGALGAHALDDILTPQKKNSWELAVQYQMVHAIGMIIIAMLYERFVIPLLRYAGGLMFIGVFLFSGSIYASALGGLEGINQIAPYGGSSFMLAWLLLAIAVLRSRSTR